MDSDDEQPDWSAPSDLADSKFDRPTAEAGTNFDACPVQVRGPHFHPPLRWLQGAIQIPCLRHELASISAPRS